MNVHPALFLLFTSGLILFWLMPFIAWLLLKGQRNTPARYWFLGTASYGIVALLFVFQNVVADWLYLASSAGFSALMVMLLIESMRLDLSQQAVRWGWVIGVSLADAVMIGLLQIAFGIETARCVQLIFLSVVDAVLLALLVRVAHRHRSRALVSVIFMLVIVITTNLLRVYRSLVYGEASGLLHFTPVSNVAFLANYLSVVFYSFGYWGYVIERGRAALMRAVQDAGEARSSENRALDRERQSNDLIRERDELIARLGAMQRIVHFGALSASIAHELNQPLASARLCAEEGLATLRATGSNDRVDAMLEKVVLENERAAAIVRTLRDLFRGQTTAIENRTLDEIVAGIVRLLERRARDASTRVVLCAAAPERVATGAGELEHVILNLLSNALDAVRAVQPSERVVEVRTWVEPDALILVVQDNGPGVPAAERDRLFDLMQSSKADGLGLGLWLSRYIVEKHGGTIDCALRPLARDRFPQPLSGAQFEVRLPRHTSA